MKIAQACRRYLLLGILIPVLGVSALAYFVSKAALTHQTYHHLQSVSAVQRARVSHLIQQNQERVRLVSSRTQLRRSVRAYLHGGAPEEAVRIRQILADAAASLPVLEDAQVLTLGGAALVGSSSGAALAGEELRSELARLGQAGEVTGRFQVESSGLRELLAGPLVLEGERLAVVLIAKSASDYLEIVSDTAGLGRTGETLLLQRDAQGNALLLLPTRHDSETALRRVVRAETGAVCVQASDGGNEPRLLAGSDYRGRRVLAASVEIPETGWTVLVKMDESEALAPVVRLRNLMAGAALLASLVGWLVALRLSGGFVRPIVALTRAAERISGGGDSERERASPSGIEELDTLAGAFGSMADRLVEKNRELQRKVRELFQERENLERLTESVGVGMVVVSADYRVLWANRVLKRVFGEQLVGAACHVAFNRRAEICPGCNLSEVFTGAAEQLVREQEGIDREGQVVWNELTITPIRDPSGRVSAALEVVVPITARKEAESEKEQLIAELQGALARIRTLSGLLPICASCKRIRDDKGYWTQLEAYLEAHSEAEFTHGICPECQEVLYPGLVRRPSGGDPGREPG